jgi:uncharacterized protein YjbI with pentapeptide repeats
LTAANLTAANLARASLTAVNLTRACGDEETKLPQGVTPLTPCR